MSETDLNNKKKKAKKPSKEEIAYNDAVGLMEAVEYTKRFEREVISLKNAAEKFDKLGEYKDAPALAEKCRELAEDARKKGTKKVYTQALDKLNSAKTKSDYVDAIEDFNRVKKYNYKVNECKENIEKCKSVIAHLETIAAYKRRGIVIGIIAVLAIIFVNTPFFPLVKGLVHQSRGEYTAAIANYKAANGILIGNSKMKKCYYALGEEAYKEEDFQKAYEYYKKAEDKMDAPLKKMRLEQMFIGEASVGDTVDFGKGKWIILDKKGNNALLLRTETIKKVPFDEDGGIKWLLSSYREWLNKKYILKFSTEERKIMVEQFLYKPASKGKLKELFFPLSEEQYIKYKDIIPQINSTYWLKDGNFINKKVKAVAKDGSIIQVKPDDTDIISRQACWVNFKDDMSKSDKK